MEKVIQVYFREISKARGGPDEGPSQLDLVCPNAQDHEEEIINYLQSAPNYSAMGKVVLDMLDPSRKTPLFPGVNTDGAYMWPLELSHYVQKYHVTLPKEFVAPMASLHWKPPAEETLNWDNLYEGVQG